MRFKRERELLFFFLVSVSGRIENGKRLVVVCAAHIQTGGQPAVRMEAVRFRLLEVYLICKRCCEGVDNITKSGMAGG